MRIIDADGHVAEGASLAVQAMQRWPRHIAPRTDGLGLVIEGRQYPEPTGPGAGCPIDHGLTPAPGLNCRTPAGVVGDAERDHIDAMVLYPSLGLCTPTLRDPGFAAGFARFYNQWLADYCATAPGRLYGVAVTPIEMGATAIEIMREAKDLGLVATHVPPGLRSKNLDHPDLDAFYAAAVDLDMPLGIHGAAGMNMPKIGVDRFTNYVQVHSIGSPFDQMSAMTSLVSGGVFDRHPGLRVAFLDAGAGWLPYFIDRLRSHFVKRGDWIEGGWRRDPYDYLAAGNIWVTCAAGEPLLSGVIDVLGEDFLMFASHYPLWSGDWPESTKPLRGRGDLSDSARRKVGARNAARFYRLD